MEDNNSMEEVKEKELEKRIAIIITIFAAILAVNGLFGGKYGDDEMIAHQKQSQMYSWYQSKGQKKMLAESKRDMIEMFEKSGLINNQHISYFDSVYAKNEKNIARYDKEKDEIQYGSAKVGKENWVQEQDGELGKIVGAEEYEAEANKLGTAGDYFDYGDLALNLSLVLGAISLVLSSVNDKVKFLRYTTLVGVVGTVLTFYALYLAMF